MRTGVRRLFSFEAEFVATSILFATDVHIFGRGALVALFGHIPILTPLAVRIRYRSWTVKGFKILYDYGQVNGGWLPVVELLL